MMDNVLRQIRDNKRQQLYLPLSSFSGPKRSYLKRGIFVKTRQWCREMDCPNGCGGLAPIRKIASGRYVAVCTHGPVTEEVAVPAEEVELCEFDAVAFEREATQEEKDAMKLTVEGARKLIPVLERLKAVVEDACAHSKDGEFLFKRKDYVDAVEEIWNNQSDESYCVGVDDSKRVNELWLNIRQGIVRYAKSIKNKTIERAFANSAIHILFHPFATRDTAPHLLRAEPIKELHCSVNANRTETTRIDRNRSPRDERRLNVEKLAQALHDAAFGLLVLNSSDRKKAMREYAKGKYWAERTGIRANSIGEIIDLKGNLVAKGGKPEDVPQLYFKICSDETFFALFEEIEKSNPSPRNTMRVDEHARRLKNELEARKNNG